ncbi:GMC family oxidoreductase [Pseudomonadales bacterium]|nr:GMC family oxidoreductase [Pseudomonadales bacterium]
MFKSLKDLAPKTELTYDICIVGTGPAGISVAKKLFDSGLKVVMLESGGLVPESGYQQLNKGENSGPSFLSLDASRLRCFGGASGLWAGVCAPFRSDDFDKKDFIPLSGWPISIDDLKAYYIEAAEMLGISYKKFYNKSFFQDTLNGISFNQFDRKNSLLSGNVFQISNSKNKDFGVKYKSEFESSENIDVLFHSTVTQLNLNTGGSEVDSVTVADLIGNKAIVKANQFVLACGALENPRILLASNTHYKEGIGNRSGFVGACFMSHPGVRNVGEVYRTSDEQCVDRDKYKPDYYVAFEMSSKQRLKHKTLRHSLSIYQLKGLESPNTYLSGRIFTQFDKILDKFDFLSSVKQMGCKLSGTYLSNTLELDVALEQPPRSSNRVSLHTTNDALGVPKIDMHWDNLSEIEKRTVVTSAETLARELGVLNIGHVKYKSELLTGESYKFNDPVNHHIGTTRMSNNCETGVVDKNCNVFGVSNLYVAGSSVFPTSSIVNPTYTIIAMSLRLGKYLKDIKL